MNDPKVIPFPRKPKPRPTNAERVSQMDAEWLRSFVPQIAQRDSANDDQPGPEAA
jgi:hypothetical protein